MTGAVVWITGLPSSGKSTLAVRVHHVLLSEGRASCVLDGDAVRDALVPHPGYDPEGRDNFYQTLGRLAAMLAHQGLVVLVPATAHLRAYRDQARARAPRLLEVYMDVSRETCHERDAKGLYQAARSCAIDKLPGADLKYEPPPAPEIIATGGEDEQAVQSILRALR